MRRWRPPKKVDPGQLQIDWNAEQSPVPAANEPAAPSPLDTQTSDTDAHPANANSPVPPSPAIQASGPQLVQRLKWDFISSFPEPRPEAMDAGVISEEDARPDNVQSLHEELARQLLQVLSEQDEVADARRRGVDPRTKAKPRTHAARERLKQYFKSEPLRLQRQWQALVGTHEDAFGEEAANAFSKAVRARHAGIPVVAGDPLDAGNAEGFQATVERPKSRRISARLPVPRPLPHAVAAGHFGHDDDGRPINPSADEVREITLSHAEELIDLLAEERGLEGSGSAAKQLRLAAEIQSAATKYAEDFGPMAAERLMAYARRQLLINDRPIAGPGPKRS